jgi:ABC-type multidrug transport system ATPase subunit
VLPPTRGSVDAAESPARIGWAPQRPALYGHLSARENLELFGRLARLEEPAGVATALLDRMGLPDGDQRASELSVGNQQRLNLALGVLGDPDVLLLDEPTASLDPAQRKKLWEMLTELRASGGAVLFATHALDEVERHADRVVVLLDGRVAFAGTAAELGAAMPELAGA